MKETENYIEMIGRGMLTILPFVGYFSGHSEGVKDGAERMGKCYEEKYRELKERMYQIRRDIFDEKSCFILPNGWDEEYWLKLLLEFLDQQETKSWDARTLIIRFIDFCLEKFQSNRNRLTETCYQLEIIRKIIEMPPAKRMKAKRDDLELATDFLYVFGSPQEIKFFSEENPEIPEQARKIFNDLLTLHNEINAAQNSSSGCNFLILGKTGTGKSSLLNYLIGEKYFEAGTGKPVTGKALYKYKAVIDNIIATVYDSWGLEAGETEKWLEILEAEKQKRDMRQKVSEWFHAIIYCVQAGGHRVEPVDIDIINSFLDEKYHVVVVITKADLVDDEDVEKLSNTLRESCPKLPKKSIVAVCSEEQTIRGFVHEPFGKEELRKAVLSGYIETIANQLPKRCIYLAKEELNKFKEQIAPEIDQLDYWDSSEQHNSWLQGKCNDFLKKFNSETYPKIIDREIKSALTINKNLAEIIKYEGNVISDPPSDEWWTDFIAKTLAVLLLVPGLIIVALKGWLNGNKITKEDADKLKAAVDKFIKYLEEKLDADEQRLHNSFKRIFNEPKQLQ